MHNHAAILLLLRLQLRARARRLSSRLFAPRRFLLTMMALVLTVFWLGNVALSVILRDPMEANALGQWLMLGLPAYAYWHLVKLAQARPEEGIPWTPAEHAMLGSRPLSRTDLVGYRFLTIFTSAILKASLFTLLMLPDLSVPIAGFVGMLLALFFLDMIRMGAEIIAWGVSNRAYLVLRCGVFLVAITACVSALLIGLVNGGSLVGGLASNLELVAQSFAALLQLAQSPAGMAAQIPFCSFVQLMLSPSANATMLGWGALSVAMVVASAWCVVRLDALMLRVVHQREIRSFPNKCEQANAQVGTANVRLRRLPRLFGAGAILWRQMLSARRHAGGLVFALGVPAGLSCLPWFMNAEPTITLWNVTGALAFYSFLLLPAALKFDFQIDIDRMALVKSLPKRPITIVIGQLATPVLLASGLQFLVLLATVVTQGANPAIGLAAWLMLVTFNIVVFGLDNLVFLLFPHRIKQEGVFIFLRSTLVFTAKGFLFGSALLVFLVWALISAWAAQTWGVPVDLTFVAGAWTFVLLCAAILIRLVVTAFVRFDPSIDVPS